MIVVLATPLRSATDDPLILDDYRLVTNDSSQTLTNEQNRVNKYHLYLAETCPNETFSNLTRALLRLERTMNVLCH